MKRLKLFLFICLTFTIISCSSGETPQTPFETLKTYTQAIKKKDVKKMKALLSAGSIKFAEDDAKAQNVTLDEIILRETFFASDQKTLKFRNEKIDGDNATIEIETSPELFDRIPFVKENGVWKIAKDKFAEEIQKQSDEEMKKMDDKINEGRQEE